MSAYTQATFRSLRHWAYRLYFIGQTTSIIGTWMQKVAQSWLVLHLTGSGTLLGVTSGLQQLPTLLLTAWGGLIADRFSRRRILMVTQCASAIPALMLGVLSLTGHITVPLIMTLALTLGIVDAFDKPARHTFPSDLVPREDVANALTLNNTMFNAGRVIGPAAAGLIIAVTGVGITFLINAASFAAVFFMLVSIKPKHLQPRTIPERESGELRKGLHYARTTPLILAPIILMTITGLTAYEWNTSIPLLARNYSTSASTVGYFFASMGAGAVLGSLSVAGAIKPNWRHLIGITFIFAVVLGVTGAMSTEAPTLVCLFFLGASSTTLRSQAMSMVQMESLPVMRGRMVSLLIMAINGTSPVSGPLIGWIGQTFSPRMAVVFGAVCTALGGLVVWQYVRHRGVSRLEEVDDAPVAQVSG